MASLKSHPNKLSTGLDYIDERSSLYYDKYTYRARVTLTGLNRASQASTFLEFLKVLERQKREAKRYSGTRIYDDIVEIDLDAISKFYDWLQLNSSHKKSKALAIRMEYNTVAFFSNDLALLKTLVSIPLAKIDFTEVDQSIPMGTKYYVKEPPHKYRVYLKSKSVDDPWKDSLRRFIDRYKDTDTVVVPSGALKAWLSPRKKQSWYWNLNWCSAHYYLDFDDDSTNTLFALMFGEMIHRRFKLEKRPTTV